MAAAVRTVLRTGALCAVLSAMHVGNSAGAQPRQESRALRSLDEWVVGRYRGAQLLGDTLGRSARFQQHALPRVESALGRRRDTLVALHFHGQPFAAAFTSGSTMRLATPTGAVSPLTGNVLARRAFRAPRVAGARTDDASQWRYGWVYLVVLPRQRDAQSQSHIGWFLTP